MPTSHIAFIGDLHGRLPAFEHTLAQAANRGVTTVIQTGDFWMGYSDPRELDKLGRIAARVLNDAGQTPDSLRYLFIDGNHEAFPALDPDAAEPVAVSSWLTYMPRGSAATLNGLRVGFLGGASSIDKAWRVEGRSWWPEENLSTDQVDRVGPADILVTHETGTAQFDRLLARNPHSRDKLYDPPGERNRVLIDKALHAAGPRAHVHGHHHAPLVSAPEGGPLTVSLSLEKTKGSVVILDPQDMTWTVAVGRKDTGDDYLADGTL